MVAAILTQLVCQKTHLMEVSNANAIKISLATEHFAQVLQQVDEITKRFSYVHFSENNFPPGGELNFVNDCISMS